MLHKLQNHKKMNIEKILIPTDSLESMHKELNKRESKIVKSTIGVLLVDFSFSKAKEIIHPALKWFNTFSGKDINLYLPGYVNGSSEDGLKYIFENNNLKNNLELITSNTNNLNIFSNEKITQKTETSDNDDYNYTPNNEQTIHDLSNIININSDEYNFSSKTSINIFLDYIDKY